LCRSADMNPRQSQVFLLEVFPWRGYRAVHDRYITSPRQVHDRLNQIQSLRGDTGNPLAHDAAARAVSRSACRVARHGAVPVFHPAAGDAHPVTASVAALDEMARADAEACPGPRVRTRPARRPSRAERRRTGRPGCAECTSRASSPGPHNGTKRARIGKASGSTDRSFGPDAVRYMSVTIATPCPTAAHHDTRRDKKETARRAAFPQRAGRFRRWWQVLGSNQRRLSRRFYRPPVFRPSAGFSRCAYATGPRLSYRQSGSIHRSRRFS